MKLYNVQIETTIVVAAESEDDAVDAAHAAIRDIERDEFLVIASEHTTLPSGWATTSIPYGHCDPVNPDKTIGQWLAG